MGGMNIAEWGQFVAIAIGGAFGLFCLFDGTRRSAAGNSDGRGGRLILIGLVIVGVLAGNAYWQHLNYADAALAYRGATPPRELPADWGKKMSPAKRETASQNMARGAYVGAGVIRQQFDISGNRKPFAPAQDDIKSRDNVVTATARLEHKADENFQAFVLWLILGLSAFIFGIGFALEPAPKPVQEEERVEPKMPMQAAVPAGVPPAAKVAVPPAAPKPAAKPPVGSDTVPLPKPTPSSEAPAQAKPTGMATVPLAKPASDTTVPLPKPDVGGDTVPIPKPPPGAFT